MPPETQFIIPGDTIIGSFTERIKDYFYLNDSGNVVQSITTDRNRIFLTLKKPSSAKLINYLPDEYYLDTVKVYEGPWLENSRGIGAFSFYHVSIVDSAKQGVSVINKNDISLQAYPNPSDGKVTVRYQLPRNEDVTIVISNLLGENIVTRAKGILKKGEYEETFDTNSLDIPDGIYLCRMQSGGKTCQESEAGTQ